MAIPVYRIRLLFATGFFVVFRRVSSVRMWGTVDAAQTVAVSVGIHAADAVKGWKAACMAEGDADQRCGLRQPNVGSEERFRRPHGR